MYVVFAPPQTLTMALTLTLATLPIPALVLAVPFRHFRALMLKLMILYSDY